MCGILAASGVSPDRFDQAVKKISHRGLRGQTFQMGSMLLHHSRLPIVGLGAEWDQPVVTMRGGGREAIAFVGEILNFREFDITYECDLPLVVNTWMEEGPEGFVNFDGFWSVIVIDDAADQIEALVDYLAQKPLYYYRAPHGKQFGIGSEPDAVAALGPVTPDEVYLGAVIKWGYCPETRRTPYNEVSKMAPGEYLSFEAGEIHLHAVDVLAPLRGPSPETLKLEIEQAIQRRVLSSDVPVSCLVSGGLDSAITYTVAKRWGDVRAYHVENEEAEWAQMVVGKSGARVCSPAKVWPEEAVNYMQEPVDLGSLCPQVALSKIITESVCLTGDGADELFGGYSRAQRYDSQASDVWHELVGWHLPRLDRVMMRNRIEVRSPFLARHVAAIALGLPRELRTDKKILRDRFRGDLPLGIADRAKWALKTPKTRDGREGNSKMLVDIFKRSRRYDR